HPDLVHGIAGGDVKCCAVVPAKGQVRGADLLLRFLAVSREVQRAEKLTVDRGNANDARPGASRGVHVALLVYLDAVADARTFAELHRRSQRTVGFYLVP